MRRIALSFSLLLTFPAVAVAAPLADEYIRLQTSAPVIRGFAIEQLQSDPDVFLGSLIEVRGTVSAVLGSERRPLLLLRSPDHARAIRLVPAPEKTLREWRFLEVGATVRVLCRLTPERRGGDTLEIVLPVLESDAAEADRSREPVAPEIVPPPHPPPAMHLAEKGLVARYTNGLRHFNPRLTEPNARFLAERILAESQAQGIDSRLLVAVLAVEGTFERARFSKKGAYLDERPAREVIAVVAGDLERRINRAGGTDARALAAVLASRRRDLTPGTRISSKQALTYSEQVVRNYAELRGVTGPQRMPAAPTRNYEARWSGRRWGVPPTPLVGTWEAVGENFVVVINATGSGVAGTQGEQIGLWRESGGYLEFRTGRVEPLRFRWRISDDRKALTVTRVRSDQSVVGTTTLLRR